MITSSPMMTVIGKKKKAAEDSGVERLASAELALARSRRPAGRRITVITRTLARKIDSSPSVSRPRWSKLMLETTLAVA